MNIYLKKFVDEKFNKPGKALDLGAGEFSDVVCLKQLKWKCEGVDKTTDVNLERPYLSKNKPFDLIYSNYVLQKIKNKKQFTSTIYDNLRNNGWFFIHTFDKSDSYCTGGLSHKYLEKLLVEQGFKNLEIKIFSYYDNKEGHKHWHRIMQATGQKI